jgi:deoxyribonuclease (pyrimidine dimer)
MTRINLVHPKELHNKHLMAEYYELPRVFTAVRKAVEKNKSPSDYSHLTEFRFGAGHVTFFYTRLNFLQTRFSLLVHELLSRNYKINRFEIVDRSIPKEWYGIWFPLEADIELSRQRLLTRLEQMGVTHEML